MHIITNLKINLIMGLKSLELSVQHSVPEASPIHSDALSFSLAVGFFLSLSLFVIKQAHFASKDKTFL